MPPKPGIGQPGGPSRKHVAAAASLKAACEETAAQAIAATIQTGQASIVHNKPKKFGSAEAARKAKIEAAKAKRAAKEAAGK